MFAIFAKTSSIATKKTSQIHYSITTNPKIFSYLHDTDIVSKWIASPECNLNLLDINGKSLLYNSIYFTKSVKFNNVNYITTKTFEILLKSGINPNICDKSGNSLLHDICWKNCGIGFIPSMNDHGNLSRFIKLLLEYNADIDIRNPQGDGPLHVIGYQGVYAKLLLENGANPNLRNIERETPLFAACRSWQPGNMIKLLLKHGAKPNLKNIYGRTALFCCYGDVKLQKILLDGGADSSIVDKMGKTYLDYWVEKFERLGQKV
jgi:hypothetical protein